MYIHGSQYPNYFNNYLESLSSKINNEGKLFFLMGDTNVDLSKVIEHVLSSEF